MYTLNKTLNINSVKTYDYPWRHFVVDELFDRSAISGLQEKISTQKINFKVLPDDPEEIQFAIFPDLDFAKYILSNEFKFFLENICGEKLRIYSKGALQLRRMTCLSPEFPAHVDFIEERTMVMLIYLSPDWSEKKGGELILQPREEIRYDECKMIEPLENRMVLFENDPHYWHSVRRVHDWERYLVMAEWVIQ